jgi:hypothetical protein
LRVNVEPAKSTSWKAVWRTAGNPTIPTLEEAASEALTLTEVAQLVQYLRPRTEAGGGVHRLVLVDLWAVK